MRKIIGGSLGAEHQSLFHVEVDSGSSPPFSAGLAHVILFVGRGAGTIEASGRHFDVLQGDGLHVRPNEWFRVASRSEEHTSEHQSLLRNPHGGSGLKKKQ